MSVSRFNTTLWTMIADAARGDGSALEAFVNRYRRPVLIYLRNRGFNDADAEDLAQEGFTLLLEKDLLAKADPQRGRFRSYLLGIMRHVVAYHERHRRAARRGGGWKRVPLEHSDALYVEEPDPTFEAAWFEGLIQNALDELREENPRQYQVIKLHMRGGRSQKEIGEELGRTAAQVKTDLHRARQRLVKSVKREIAGYVASAEELQDEVKLLLKSMQ